jgi:hypothetical protein
VKTQKQSLRKIVRVLNNHDEDGGFWLPHIQRAFVWSEEQIARLFDSILREYPISTLLIWKTKSSIRMRRFIDEFRPEYRQNLVPFFTTPDESRKSLVLDGQQRLQSLFIGLSGSYAGRELYFHVLSGDVAAPDDVRYRFQFLDKAKAAFPWVKFKDVVFSTKDPFTFVNDMVHSVDPITDDERARIFRNIGQVFKTFHSDEGIGYQELDSIENPALYTEDDVVEVFIRANSGGTKLGKSDLLFSLLAAGWDGATEELESLLESLNAHGFEFTRDFVLKTCLALFDQGARYEVPKFRQPAVRAKIEERWDEISAAMQEVLDFVRGSTFIKCDKALPSYNVLIPLIYLRYNYQKQFKAAKGLDQYLIRASLAGAFSGQPDQLIDQLTANIKKNGAFDLQEAFGVIRSEGRSLELTESRLWQLGYGLDTVHLLFNLWYRDVDGTYTPSYPNNLPQVDHVFPQSVLRKVKAKNPSTGRMDVLRYREGERNQLANCMLLTAQENGAGGKSDTPPDQWFADKTPEYLTKHLIPQDPALWQLDKFEEFIEQRKALILTKMRELKLVAAEADPVAPAAAVKPVSAGAFTSIPPAEELAR